MNPDESMPTEANETDNPNTTARGDDSKPKPKLGKKRRSLFEIGGNLLKKIAFKTSAFIKKNHFIKVNFQRVLKVALLALLIEYFVYFVLQVVFWGVPSLRKLISTSHMGIPIACAGMYLLMVIFILAFQHVANKAVYVFKCLEFALCAVCFSKHLFRSGFVWGRF